MSMSVTKRHDEMQNPTSQTWNRSWNKCGTKHDRTACKTVDQQESKSLRGKDGRALILAHNPKVGGSNPPPATKNFFPFSSFRKPATIRIRRFVAWKARSYQIPLRLTSPSATIATE